VINLKVFFIGFNKSGTTTYHDIMSQHFKSIHDVGWAKASRYNRKDYPYRLKNYFSKADCWSDGEDPDFERLASVFPEAKFILNDRCERNWLRSLVKHVHRPAAKRLKGAHYEEFVKKGSGREKSVIAMWLQRRRKYYERVFRFFNNQPDSRFMVIDIEKDNVVQKLSNFLNVNFVPGVDSIWSNRSSINDNYVQKYLDMVDEVIKESSP
jgi:hypothetical protein